MYPINAASPQRVAIGAVVQISDGAVQTSGVSVKVLPQGTTASAGGGTIAYEEGVVHYLPTQAETNYASFILIAYKTGCIPATVTIVTSASGTAGHAAVDWGVVINKTTTNALTGTTIATTQKVDVETIKTNPVVNAGTVTFPSGATLASTTNITAGTITTTTNLTNLPAITANWLTAAGMDATASAEIADAVWDEALAGHVGAGSTGEALSAAGGAGDPWITALPGAYGAGSAGYIVGTNLNATVSSRASQASVDTVDGIVNSILVDTAEIGAAGAGLTNINLPNQTMDIVGNITGNLSGSVGSVGSAVTLTTAGYEAAADALLNRNISGGSNTGRTVKQAYHFIRNKWVIAAGSLTVYDTDDTTSSWTSVVTGTAGADPVTGTDPA